MQQVMTIKEFMSNAHKEGLTEQEEYAYGLIKGLGEATLYITVLSLTAKTLSPIALGFAGFKVIQAFVAR